MSERRTRWIGRALLFGSLAVLVLGDDAGLFGRGSSGEGSDATDLRLPGVQQDLLDAVLETGVPVVLVLITGRPYALGAVESRLAAAVQAFFPGQEGSQAIAGVLSGRVTPSGRLPLGVDLHLKRALVKSRGLGVRYGALSPRPSPSDP